MKPPTKKEKVTSKMGNANKGVAEIPSNSSLGTESIDPQNFVCVEDIEKDD